jgi:sugar O-acyltransferase (sialic acid O-acetyltransferase NeuD family)
MQNELYIIGAGGLGREIANSLHHGDLNKKFTFRGFIDDAYPVGDVVNGIPVHGGLSWINDHPAHNFMIAVSDVKKRKELVVNFNDLSLKYATIIHPGAPIYDNFFNKIGEGSFIGDGVILTINILVGRHCQILPGCTLSHDTIIGDFCTLMPGVRITSGATIGNGVTIGAGAIIAKNTIISDNTTIPPGSLIA